MRALQKPEVQPAPEAFEKPGASGAQGGDAVGQDADVGDLKIGSFEAPERVPDYEILEESTNRREGARAARLLIDTRSRGEEPIRPHHPRPEVPLFRLRRRLGGVHRHRRRALLQRRPSHQRPTLLLRGRAHLQYLRWLLYIGYIYTPPNLDGY